jgi:hypothetical protein
MVYWQTLDDSHFCCQFVKEVIYALGYSFSRKTFALPFRHQKILNLIRYRMRYFFSRGDFYKLDFQTENFLLVQPSLIFVMIVV